MEARANIVVDYRIRSGPRVADGDIVRAADGGKATASEGKYLLLHQYPAGTFSKPDDQEEAPGIPSDIWLSLNDVAIYQGEKMLQVMSLRSLAGARKVRDSIPQREGGSIKLIRIEIDCRKVSSEEVRGKC